MTGVRFVEGDLPDRASGSADRINWRGILAELSTRPGKWAEVRREPVAQRAKLGVQAANVKSRFRDVEAATRQIGDECVLYVRVVK